MNVINPFNSVGPINDRRKFSNRRVEVEKLLNNLLSSKPICLSLIGQRKIGKTSLAFHLSRATTIEEFGFDGDRYCFIYFNCQKYPQALRSYENFYQAFLDHLIPKLPEPLPDLFSNIVVSQKANNVIRIWDNVLEELWNRNYFIIAIFDEFDKAIMQETLIKDGLFGSLRGYANDAPNFSWITCTNRPLHVLFEESFNEHQVSRSKRISESDFYNIAVPHVVKLFSTEDIEQLIRSLLSMTESTFSDDEIEAIIRCGGNFPFFIQRASFHFFNAHVTNCLKQEFIVEEFLKEAIPIWEGFWNKLDARHQKILSSIANGHPTRATDYELNSLIDSALIYKDQLGNLSPFSLEFGRFILSLNPNHSELFQVEQKLHDRFVVRGVITTNHSQVIKAKDEELNRFVAIKFPRLDLFNNDITSKLQKNLRREANVLAKLNHPNIGKIFDIIDEPVGIIMEWVEGQSLQDILDEKEVIPLFDIIAIAVGLAEALEYSHREGVIHRDIKPNNIILTQNKTPKLIDFDIARDYLLETITLREDGSRFQVGTPRYSSPEQIVRLEQTSLDRVRAPTDIFSLGVVLYELLTMNIPYTYGNDTSLYESNHFPLIDSSNIPDSGLYDLLVRMLSEETDLRPDASTLVNELKKLLNSLHTH